MCSNSAYFNEYDAIELQEKNWIKNKKIFLLDQHIKNQIIDLYKYQTEIKNVESIPGEIKKLIANGQYKMLTEQEVNTLNDWIDGLYKKKNDTAVVTDSNENNGAA